MQFAQSSCITMLLLLLFSFASFRVSLSLDTLRQGDSLNSSSRLVSSGNIFTLGFYSTYNNNNSYLTIRYTFELSRFDVWTGNSNNPIPNNTIASLTISRTGSLIITTGEEYTFPLYESSEARQNVSATLLDTGNFVLKAVSASGEDVILWQSFDYPTDTILPGMKLGVDHRTGRRRKLTSWSSYRNPASGTFTLEWESITHRLIVRQRGVFNWTSGGLIDYYDKDYNLRVKRFENLPAPNPLDFNYNFTNITSKDEDFFLYSLIQVPNVTPADRMVTAGWFLTMQGDLSEIYNRIRINHCDGSDVILGCRCNYQRQYFTSYGYFRLPNGESLLPVPDENSDIDLRDCMESCWSDCDCAGFTYSSGCRYWIGRNLTFESSLSNEVMYIRGLGSSNNSTSGSSNNRKRMLTWTIIAVVTAVLLLLVAALVLMRRSKQRKREVKMNELLTLPEMYDHEDGSSRGHDLRSFTHATLIAATSNFSSEYKLGEGGFGPVYKGQTTEGEEIAVKVLSRSSGQGLLEFKNEITLISKLQHVNLVKLVGFCTHGEDKIIVYDYMPNKSLDFFLFDPTMKQQLDWGRRFNIIDGISQGLLYLHKYSRLNIVHRDLKSSNILLDENLNPKISDFGLARIFKQNADEANTNRRVGTYGYMAPEYAMQGIFSFKSDVYSFGVLLLEIVSGRRNSSFKHIDGLLNLVEYAWDLWSKDSALELLDPTLVDSCNIEQLHRCVIIGLLCVENRASDRPNIEEVISMLKNEMMSLPIPQNPAFITRNRLLEELGQSSSSKISANEISVSGVGGR